VVFANGSSQHLRFPCSALSIVSQSKIGKLEILFCRNSDFVIELMTATHPAFFVANTTRAYRRLTQKLSCEKL
jgi:hypothetical protein